VDPFQGAIVAPLFEVHVDSGVRREVVREHAPSAAASQDVEDGIDYRPKVRSSRPSSRLTRRQEARDHPPFRVIQIARISHEGILARLSGLPKHPLTHPPGPVCYLSSRSIPCPPWRSWTRNSETTGNLSGRDVASLWYCDLREGQGS
jgi:hypothetical protein